MSTASLFVYGSLKRGGRHHDELRGAAFLGEAESMPGYSLVQLGDYLALVEGPVGGVVRGELFDVPVDLLPTLDEFEGDAYVRQNLAVKLSGATDLALALAYFRKAR